MLTIRKEQMEVLARSLLDAFEAGALAHVRGLFPEDCAKLTEEQLRELVHEGIARGRSYGLTGKRDLLTFIEHMFILGPDFDCAAEYVWARDLLTNRDFASATKADLLVRLTMKHLRSTAS
jgi:hypothetical protein